ncbi:MAG: metallophosphoesterase [Armatimonadota bacterium]|nr:metallophosphoesterase [Armatimonadota bacterium]
MKIAHFSDTHLGYSRYARTDERGINQRTVDVVDTFQKVLHDILVTDPDVVIHAGDFFDSVQPLNLVIVAAYKRLVRFQKLRGGRPMIIIAGNHDSPKTIGKGNILTIFGEGEASDYSIPGVYVVESHAKRIVLPDIGFEALALPWSGENAAFDIRPEDRRNVSILIAHGLEQSLGMPGATLSLSRMNYPEWNYVALGDYHFRKPLADNVWYSGSTDYTSSNFWEEEKELKGWNLFDSETGETRFMHVEPLRAPRTLEQLDASGLSGEDIGAQLIRNAHWDVDAQPIIRQIVTNCDPIARSEVPADVRSELQSRALHYELKMLLAASVGVDTEDVQTRGATLEDDWKAYAEARQLPLGVDREEFVGAGHKVMKEAAGDPQED